ncbi:hypothetical protein HMPREF9080_00422 [Cardiobacterium valvarum F0432]|uniref:Uncharacterized protein n=1 Tax=Cardiobacterium valvarum F0432 TaxID=797473 RepID=G9ZCE5_9GAMM|nr:hypothetical protein HMPREF9080_00422 [Cardiobacterium valvarum F0432]
MEACVQMRFIDISLLARHDAPRFLGVRMLKSLMNLAFCGAAQIEPNKTRQDFYREYWPVVPQGHSPCIRSTERMEYGLFK